MRRVGAVAALAALLAGGSLAITLRNAAPCLDDRPSKTSEDTLKDDWACFTFCSGPGAERPRQCDDCCLAKGATEDDHPGEEPTEVPGTATQPAKEGGATTKKDKDKGEGGGETTEGGADSSSEKGETSSEAAGEGGGGE